MNNSVKELERKLGRLMHISGGKDVDAAALAVAREMRNLMKAKIKDKTGTLRDAIVARKFRTPGEGITYVAVNKRKAPHAHLVEFGHGGPHPAPPHEFFRPVLDEYSANGRYEAALADAFEKQIKKAIK